MDFRPQARWGDGLFNEQASPGCSQWIPLHDAVSVDPASQVLEFPLAAPVVTQQTEVEPFVPVQSASARELQLCVSTYVFRKAVVDCDASLDEAGMEQLHCARTTPVNEKGEDPPKMSSTLTYPDFGAATPRPTDAASSAQEDSLLAHVTFPDVIEIIAGHIWKFLSFADLAALESTSMRLFGICETDALWRQIYHHHACSPWRCEEREVIHSCEDSHRARQTALLQHSKREGHHKSANALVDPDFDFVQNTIACATDTVAQDSEIATQEVCSMVEKISCFVSRAMRRVRQSWLQSVVQLSGGLGITRWFRLNQTAALNLCGERALLYAVGSTGTMENCGTFISPSCSSTKEKKMLQDTDITASLSETLATTSDSTSALRGEVPLLPVSRFKVMLLEEFANVEEEKLALLKERVALLKDINRFRHELRHLILNFENPATSSSSRLISEGLFCWPSFLLNWAGVTSLLCVCSSFSAPQERLLYLKELLANQPDRSSEIENVTTRVIPRVLATVRAFHHAIHAFQIRTPAYCKENITHSIF